MEPINYLGLGLKDNSQIGSDTTAGKEINLNDGLSLEELKIIDNDGDGQITLTEFQNAYGDNKEKSKEIYLQTLNWLNSTSIKNNDGTTTYTQRTNDSIVESKYDQDGKLISYKSRTEDSVKDKIYVEECEIKNKARVIKKHTESIDGLTIEEDYKNGDVVGTSITKNNTKVSQTNYGRIVEVKNKNIRSTWDGVFIEYSDKGTIASVKIMENNQEIASGDEISFNKDTNSYEIKNSKGKVIASKYEENGKIIITQYKKEKKHIVYTIDSKGNPISTVEYDKEGKKIKYQKNTSSGITKEYSYDSEGKLVSSTEYSINGNKISTEEYYKNDASKYYADQKGYLVKNKTIYDANGHFKEYQTFSYHSGDKSEVVKEINSYSDTQCNNLISKSTLVQDSYGNTKQKTLEENGQISKTEYRFKSDIKGRIAIPSGYSEVIETYGNKVIKYTYKFGTIAEKQISQLNNGVVSETANYEYTYFSNSNNKIKQLKFTDKNGFTQITNYNIDNSSKVTYITKNNIKYTQNFDKTGIIKTLESEFYNQKSNLLDKAAYSSTAEERQNANERIDALNKNFETDINKYEASSEQEYSKIKYASSKIEKTKMELDHEYNKNRIVLLRKLLNTSFNDKNSIDSISNSLTLLYIRYLENLKNLK